MARPVSRIAVTWGGRLLMVLSLIYVGFRLWSYRSSFIDHLANPTVLLVTLLSAVIYAISCFLLAFGWWMIMHSGRRLQHPIRWERMWIIYAKTQVAKYIPGNIFHIAGRHLLTAGAGGSHSLLLAAAILEILMLLLATGTISLLAAGNLISAIRFADPHVVLALAVGGSLAAVAAIYMSKRYGVQRILTE
jgi:glycosyltransferase 2 family protein